MAYYDTIQGTEEFLEAGQMFQSMMKDLGLMEKKYVHICLYHNPKLV